MRIRSGMYATVTVVLLLRREIGRSNEKDVDKLREVSVSDSWHLVTWFATDVLDMDGLTLEMTYVGIRRSSTAEKERWNTRGKTRLFRDGRWFGQEKRGSRHIRLHREQKDLQSSIYSMIRHNIYKFCPIFVSFLKELNCLYISCELNIFSTYVTASFDLRGANNTREGSRCWNSVIIIMWTHLR